MNADGIPFLRIEEAGQSHADAENTVSNCGTNAAKAEVRDWSYDYWKFR